MNEWTSEIGETLKTCLEPENIVNKIAVAVEKEGQIVGHLNKENSDLFVKTIFYFLHANHGNTCRSWSSREKAQFWRWARYASTMYSSVLRRRKVYKNIEKQFSVIASICLFLKA